MNIYAKNTIDAGVGTASAAVFGAVIGAICGTKVKEMTVLCAIVGLFTFCLKRQVNELIGANKDELTTKVIAVDVAISALNAAVLIIGARKLGVFGPRATSIFGGICAFGMLEVMLRDERFLRMSQVGFSWTNNVSIVDAINQIWSPKATLKASST